MLATPSGAHVTPRGVRECVDVAVRYCAAWMHRGEGVLVRDGKIEDLATAEICRVRHRFNYRNIFHLA